MHETGSDQIRHNSPPLHTAHWSPVEYEDQLSRSCNHTLPPEAPRVSVHQQPLPGYPQPISSGLGSLFAIHSEMGVLC